MKNILYGDGIHDDYPAIQEMLDSGICEVVLPAPEEHYLISQTLVLSSNTRLVLPRFAEIKLADGANCPMLCNRMVKDYAERLPDYSNKGAVVQNEGPRHLFHYVNEYSPDAPCCNIEVVGGVWNFNNLEQIPNPLKTKVFEPAGYTGYGFLFYHVKNFNLSSMTLKDPVNFAVVFDTISYFTVEDIIFDFNHGNPCEVNMDGIHLNGNCHFGVIRNLKGTTYDDLVALNAHEGSRGPITNIVIDGLFAENCHSAVRLLSVNDRVENIHITNVYGTYYHYCIGITKFYKGETTGMYDGISIDHIYASKVRPGNIYRPANTFVCPFIYIQKEIRAKNIKITDLYRQEYHVPIETIFVGENAEIENLILDTIVSENHTQEEIPLLNNCGTIRRLVTKNLCTNGETEITGEGIIEIKEQS